MSKENTGYVYRLEEVGLGFDQGVVSTHKGSRSEKEENEDNYWPHKSHRSKCEYIDYLIAGRLYIVADGVSGGLKGHEASKIAAETMANTYYERILQLERPPKQEDVERILRDAVMTANEELLARSRELRGETKERDKKKYLQTTIVCALLRGNTLTIANVGDSHLYQYRSRQVTLLYQPTQRNFVGTNLSRDEIEIHHHPEPITKEDILILCSDGLYNYLDPDNEPENAPAEMTAIVNDYLSQKGIKHVTHELLSKANDEFNEGGGDNITVMLIQPGAASERELPDELDRLIWQAWGPNASQDDLIELRQACNDRTVKESETSKKQIWSRRAAQLGFEAPGAKELREAEELYKQLTLDFDKNHNIVQQITQLRQDAPTQLELANLARRATISLADSALIPALEKRKLEIAYDLLSEFSKAPEVKDKLDELEKELGKPRTTADGSDGQKAPTGMPARFTPNPSANTPHASERRGGGPLSTPPPSRPTLPLSEGAPKPPKTTEAWPEQSRRVVTTSQNPTTTSTSSGKVRQRTTKTPRSQSVWQRSGVKTVLALLLLAFVLTSSAIFVTLADFSSPIELAEGMPTVPTDITSDVGQAIEEESTLITPEPTPTATTEVIEPSATAIPTTGLPSQSATATPAPPTSPDLQLAEPTYELLEQEGARKKLKLMTRLSLKDTSSLESNTMLEVETRLPVGLSPAGAGKPEVKGMKDLETSEIIMTQRVALSKVDPSDALFESIIIVEPPHSREPTYTIPVIARLKGAAGEELYSDSKAIQIAAISHEAALSITQSVPNQLVTINDTISFNVTITNTGQTWIDRVLVKSEQVPAGLNVDTWQSQLDTLGALEPGQSKQISLPMQVQTDNPMRIDLSLPLEGRLGDESVIEASRAPTQLEIYARGRTSIPAGFGAPHPLRESPGVGSDANPTKLWLLNQSEVKVLDAVVTELNDGTILIWYQLEVMTQDGQPIRGWLWNQRVTVENDAVRVFLIDKANGN